MSLSERALRWAYFKMAPVWTAWALGAVLLLVPGWSIEHAAWVPDSSPISFNLLAGGLCGACLGSTRWRGRWAAGYTLILALAATLQPLGKLVPPLTVITQLPPLALFDLMNIRLLSLYDRLAGWLALYQAGESIRDTGLFLLIFGLAAWLAGAWLGWCIRRTRRALAGILPVGLLLALNVNFSAQDAWVIVTFLEAALLLLARAAYSAAHDSWDRRQVDYPEDLGFSWAGWAATLAVILALVARAAPLVGTPQGWKAINDFLHPVQQQLEDTASRIFADVRPPVSTAVPLPRAETPQLGSVGAPPSQGLEVLFYVKTSDPPPPPSDPGVPEQLQQSGPRHYWRSQVFATYTGQGWQPPPLDSDPFPTPPPAQDAPPGRYTLEQEFEINAQYGAELFAANQPVRVEAGSAELRTTAGDVLTTLLTTRPAAGADTYKVISWAARLTEAQLNAAPRPYPPEISSLYLQLPPNVPRRVSDLAARIVAGASTSYQMATRIQDYLRLTYPYSISVPPPPEGQDVVDYFLFQSESGFCSYYASAMAVMLRTQGVAARVASGFANGTYDESKGAYQVLTGDAHAWVEVYFPGLGWVEFEPTAIMPRPNYAAGGQAGPTLPTPAPPAGLPAGLTTALLGLVLLAGGGLLYLLFRFNGRSGPGLAADPARQARALYYSMRRSLAQAGLGGPPSLTPAEYLDRARPALSGQPALAQALEQATTLYQQAAYAPHPPTLRAVETARLAWRRSFWEWLKLAGGRWRSRLRAS